MEFWEAGIRAKSDPVSTQSDRLRVINDEKLRD